MYESFYGLTGRPFSTVPDADSVFWSEGHAQALAMLQYGVSGGAPLTVLTGEIGSGKTTLIRCLLAELPDDLSVGLVSAMTEGRGALLDWVLMALGEAPGTGNPVEAFHRFQDLAVRRYAEGGRLLLILDEAQALGPRTLEELRLLTNVNSDGAVLVQLVLAGQPGLRERLGNPALRQFAQRVAADFHLDRLSAAETADYIEARLKCAGAARPVFASAASALIHDAAGGLPRLINILADLALVHGYAAGRPAIGEDLVREVFASARARGTYGQFTPPAKRLTLVPEGAAVRVEA